MIDDDELVQAFLEESRENLDQVDSDLVELEARPQDPELLARVFRAVHTIKGTSGFLGYDRLQQLSHAGEDLLGALRSGDLLLDAEITTSLLRLVDELRSVLDRVAVDGQEGDADHADVIADLARHLPGAGAPDLAAAPPEPVPPEPVPPEPVPPEPVATATPSVPPAPAPAATAPAESSVRVDVAVLDKLQDLVGELTLTRNRIGEVVDTGDVSMAAPYQQLRLLTRELQDNVMRARLQPVGTVIGKVHRLVRDLSTELGKSVRVEVSGEDVGVDRSIVEALRDPITHLVRNAVDHGIETPEDRVRTGKPAQAVLRLAASVEAGRVLIDVSDDGRGIDAERVAQRAVDAGLLTPAQAAGLNAAERLELIFRPGLSTRTQATTVSGRGVGMDIVRDHIDRIGGTVGVRTEVGEGTRFRLDVPLTLAVVPAVTVRCGGGTYAVPQVDVSTVLHLEADRVAGTVDRLGAAGTLRFQEHLIPLVGLREVLGVDAAPAGAGDLPDGDLQIVVLRSHGRRYALVVDEVGDSLEAVAKPLPEAVRSVRLYAGATILPDGRPALILDVAAIGVHAGVTSSTLDDDVAAVPDESRAGLLLATGRDGERVAFPLEVVERVEHVDPADVARTGDVDVVRYRDTLLPLLGLHPDATASTPTVTVVVCATRTGSVGVVVAGVDDVAVRPEVPEQPAPRPGVSARLVVDDLVVELLDVDALVAATAVAPAEAEGWP